MLFLLPHAATSHNIQGCYLCYFGVEMIYCKTAIIIYSKINIAMWHDICNVLDSDIIKLDLITFTIYTTTDLQILQAVLVHDYRASAEVAVLLFVA